MDIYQRSTYVHYVGHRDERGLFSRLSICVCLPDVVLRRPTELCTMFGRLLGCYSISTFSDAFAPDGVSPRAKFILRPPSLAFSYIGSVTAQHSSSGVSQA